MSAGRPVSWGRLAPRRGGWIRLLAAVSTYILVTATLLTAAGKTISVGELDAVDLPYLQIPSLSATDLVVYIGLAAIFAACEARWRFAGWVTIPLALLVGALGAMNAWYLVIAGEQATWPALRTLWVRTDDILDVVKEGLSEESIIRYAIAVFLIVGLPLAIRWTLSRRSGPWVSGAHGRDRALCAAWLTVVAGLIVLLTPPATDVEVGKLKKNAIVSIVRTFLIQFESGSFVGFDPVRIVDKAEVARFSKTRGPNLVLFILESTRYDHTTLSGDASPADTPNLLALAQRGFTAHNTRAVVPHTSKSIFSILCARTPTMQQKLVETSADLNVQCLPSILAEAGYDTAFFQSAQGVFEERPRLVDKLGFDHFAAWEEIGGQKVGYLASDDESLSVPLVRWIDEVGAQARPFFATLLTSAAHYPYRLPAPSRKRAREEGLPHGTAAERFARLIEAEDHMLGVITKALRARNLLDDTIIVVVGDHGEGFGAHGVKQHDNNYYEEGLRVPFVMAGPGVPVMERRDNASLVDVTPTVLSALGIALDDAARSTIDGYDAMAGDFPTDRPRWFGCFLELRCRGFVLGMSKLIYEPRSNEAWYYDLAVDPNERNPQPPPRELGAAFRELNRFVGERSARDWTLVHDANSRYGDWICEENSLDCQHPRGDKQMKRRAIQFIKQKNAIQKKQRKAVKDLKTLLED